MIIYQEPHCVVSMEVEAYDVLADDLIKGKHVDGKDERSEHRALRETLIDWGQGVTGVTNGDKLFPVGEI